MFVLLIVLAVVVLVGLIKFRMVVEYNEEGLHGFWGAYFIRIHFPKRKKKKQKPLQTETGKPSGKTFGNLKKFEWMLKPVLKSLGKLVRMITVNRLEAQVKLAGENAASTALMYGGAVAGISTVFPILDSNLKIRKKSISVSPDFESTESTINLCAEMSIRLWRLVLVAIFLLYKLITQKNINKKEGNEKNG